MRLEAVYRKIAARESRVGLPPCSTLPARSVKPRQPPAFRAAQAPSARLVLGLLLTRRDPPPASARPYPAFRCSGCFAQDKHASREATPRQPPG